MSLDLCETVHAHLEDVMGNFDYRKVGKTQRSPEMVFLRKTNLTIEEIVRKERNDLMANIRYTKIAEREKHTLVVFSVNRDTTCMFGILPYDTEESQLCIWNWTARNIVDWLMPENEVGTKQFQQAHKNLLDRTHALTFEH